MTIDGPGQMTGKTGDPGYTANYDIIIVLWWREEYDDESYDCLPS